MYYGNTWSTSTSKLYTFELKTGCLMIFCWIKTFPSKYKSIFSSSGVGMKIHEKILTHYLSCTSPVDKEGYLFKKVRKNMEHWNYSSHFPRDRKRNNPAVLLHRKSEMPPTSGGGLSWRQTCFSTRSDQLTDTCWGSSSWRDVQSSARRLTDSFPFPWCLKGPDSKPTDLQPEIGRLRRAGRKLCSQPATVTSLCWWETWGGSMKVCYDRCAPVYRHS